MLGGTSILPARAVKAIPAATPKPLTRTLSQLTMGFDKIEKWGKVKSERRTYNKSKTVFDIHVISPSNKSFGTWNISYQPNEPEITHKAAVFTLYLIGKHQPPPSPWFEGVVTKHAVNRKYLHGVGAGRNRLGISLEGKFALRPAPPAGSSSSPAGFGAGRWGRKMVLDYTPVSLEEDNDSNKPRGVPSVSVLSRLYDLRKKRIQELPLLVDTTAAEPDFDCQEVDKASEEKEAKWPKNDDESPPLVRSLPMFLGGGPF